MAADRRRPRLSRLRPAGAAHPAPGRAGLCPRSGDNRTAQRAGVDVRGAVGLAGRHPRGRRDEHRADSAVRAGTPGRRRGTPGRAQPLLRALSHHRLGASVVHAGGRPGAPALACRAVHRRSRGRAAGRPGALLAAGQGVAGGARLRAGTGARAGPGRAAWPGRAVWPGDGRRYRLARPGSRPGSRRAPCRAGGTGHLGGRGHGRAGQHDRAGRGQGAGPLHRRLDRGGAAARAGRVPDREADAPLRVPRPAGHREDRGRPGPGQDLLRLRAARNPRGGRGAPGRPHR